MINIIMWIIFGALAGFIADLFDRSVTLSWMERIVVGIIGAFVGGLLVNLLTTGTIGLTGSNDFNIISIFVAVVGALIALMAYKRMRPRHAA